MNPTVATADFKAIKACSHPDFRLLQQGFMCRKRGKLTYKGCGNELVFKSS